MPFIPDKAGFVPDEEQTQQPKGVPTPANAGMVNFAASMAGLPATAATGLLNLPPLAIAAGARAIGKPIEALDRYLQDPVRVPGEAEFYRQKFRGTGMPGLSPDNPDPTSQEGTAAYELASKGAMIPGMALPALAAQATEMAGFPEYAGVAAMGVPTGVRMYNDARAPALEAARQRNSVRDATNRQALDAGYRFPPSATNPTVVGNIIESFGGKAAIKQQSVLGNQEVTNALAARELGIPPNTPITPGLLNTLRTNAGQAYQRVAAISPVAANALQRLRDARAETSVQWNHYHRSGTPEAQRAALRSQQMEDMLEQVIERQARAAGRPELVQELTEARRYIAKTHDIERALNESNADISAHSLGSALDRGRHLSGNLGTIARTDLQLKPFMGDASRTPAPDVSALNPLASGALMYGGASAFGLPGLLMGGIPLLRGPARSLMLSEAGQNLFGVPSYSPGISNQPALATLLQQAAMEQTQK